LSEPYKLKYAFATENLDMCLNTAVTTIQYIQKKKIIIEKKLKDLL